MKSCSLKLYSIDSCPSFCMLKLCLIIVSRLRNICVIISKLPYKECTIFSFVLWILINSCPTFLLLWTFILQIPTNSFGLIEYRAHPFWLQKYCPSHEHDGTPRCCSCERMEVGLIYFIMLMASSLRCYKNSTATCAPICSRYVSGFPRMLSYIP